MITPEQKTILNDYAEIKRQIKFLEFKAEILNPQVLELMQQNELGEIEIGEVGKLTLGSRRTWKYPEEITKEEESLKEKKKTAEQLGTATYVEKGYVVFKANKDDI